MQGGVVVVARLLVRVLAMTDGTHFDQTRSVVDVVDDAIVTHAHAPQVASAAELLAATRARVGRQRVELARDAAQDRGGKRLELLPCRAGEAELIHVLLASVHRLQTTLALQAASHGRPGHRPLAGARARQGDVEEVLPERAVALQVDEDPGALAVGVVQVFHPSHGRASVAVMLNLAASELRSERSSALFH